MAVVIFLCDIEGSRGEVKQFLRDWRKETEEWSDWRQEGGIPHLSFTVISHTCVIWCSSKTLCACAYVREHAHLHTSVDLTSICTSVLYLFSCHENTECMFVMTRLTRTMLTSVDLHILCFKPCSCLTPVAVLCQRDRPEVWLLSGQLN